MTTYKVSWSLFVEADNLQEAESSAGEIWDRYDHRELSDHAASTTVVLSPQAQKANA